MDGWMLRKNDASEVLHRTRCTVIGVYSLTSYVPHVFFPNTPSRPCIHFTRRPQSVAIFQHEKTSPSIRQASTSPRLRPLLVLYRTTILVIRIRISIIIIIIIIIVVVAARLFAVSM